MVQTLKRVYLYTAATFALLFVAAISIILLNTLLRLAGMLPYYVDPYGGTFDILSLPPDSQTVTQIVVLFVVTAVLVGALFGGGHYWLIRRDARGDAGADAGVVRHVFLNGLMALAALVAVPTALVTLANIDQTQGTYDPAISLSFALVSGLVFLYVFLERRRVDPAGRAAPIMRQIQEDGMQGILLIIASFVTNSGLASIFRYILVNTHAATSSTGCVTATIPEIINPCPPLPLLSPILTTLFAIAAWGLYIWLNAWSRGAVLQRVLWYAALGYGLIWLLYGLAGGVYTAFAPLFGDANAWQEALNASLFFVGELLTGLLITLAYALGLQRLAAREQRLRAPVQQGLLAISAAISAGFFLTGLILLLSGLVERVVHAGNPPDADGWATAWGILVAGIVYPFFWLRLRRASDPARGGPTIPRRVYVLVLLAGTAIGALIAAVFLVYQIVASALGLASANAQLGRQSAVVLVVLGALALYHLGQLRADLRAVHARAAPMAAAGVPVATILPEQAAAPPGEAETLESILQRVSAGALDPTSAAARIRGLSKL